MKVLIIHNKYLSKNVGGEDLVFRNEVKCLREKLGHDHVYEYSVSNDEISKVKLLFSIWFSTKHYREISKLVKDKQINLVHVHNFFPLLTPSVFLAAKRSGAKVVHTLHNFRLWCISGILFRPEAGICELCVNKKFPLSGIKYACYRNSKIQSLLAQLAFTFYKGMNFFNYVDKFLVLTEFQKNKVIDLGVQRQKIILKPNGVSISLISGIPKKNFIFVGRLEEAKGVKVLLDAWKQLTEDYHLTLVGEGELFESVKAPHISFIGKKPHGEVQQLIAGSRYLVQPSLWYETFGLTIIEAMAVGTPVIGFNIGTRPNFIENGKNGFLCEQDQLVETIKMAQLFDGYLELSKYAIQTSQKFSNELITSKQVLIYEQIINE